MSAAEHSARGRPHLAALPKTRGSGWLGIRQVAPCKIA